MSFTPISIHKYIKLFIQDNPKTDEKELRQKINNALTDYKNGITCSCGKDIWVVASASGENICYSCLTGKAVPSEEDYEITEAIDKKNTGSKNNQSGFSQLKGLFDV